jgi:hypothetical protein
MLRKIYSTPGLSISRRISATSKNTTRSRKALSKTRKRSSKIAIVTSRGSPTVQADLSRKARKTSHYPKPTIQE